MTRRKFFAWRAIYVSSLIFVQVITMEEAYLAINVMNQLTMKNFGFIIVRNANQTFANHALEKSIQKKQIQLIGKLGRK